jgi:ring-1,2-phenylacetyl-CoA epoxidase subunit PaaD
VTQVAVIDEAAIMAVLAGVPDPEIPAVSVLELGIVRGVERDGAAGKVIITPTYSGCPATHYIEQSIREALDAAGFRAVGIETRIAPPWTTDWISAAGHDKLRRYGIAPPSRSVEVACPQCGSIETEEVSRFGSTPCKSQYRCRACLEPFDRFKCH